VTGLSRETLARGAEAELTEADLKNAAPEHKPFLAGRVGRTICSIVAEAQALSMERQTEGFAPSVPFVACLSACLEVTELVRFVTTGATSPAPRYQMNLLIGPDTAMDIRERRRTNCICVERIDNIQKVRAMRLRADT
jgi:hypothetical protein